MLSPAMLKRQRISFRIYPLIFCIFFLKRKKARHLNLAICACKTSTPAPPKIKNVDRPGGKSDRTSPVFGSFDRAWSNSVHLRAPYHLLRVYAPLFVHYFVQIIFKISIFKIHLTHLQMEQHVLCVCVSVCECVCVCVCV